MGVWELKRDVWEPSLSLNVAAVSAGAVHAVPGSAQHVLPDEHHPAVHAAVRVDAARVLRSSGRR